MLQHRHRRELFLASISLPKLTLLSTMSCRLATAPLDEAESSSDESDASSSSAASTSSSSSGSSLGFSKPQPAGKKRKATDQDPESDVDYGVSDDNDEPVGKLDLKSAAARFASKHEILDPTIPKLQIDSLPSEESVRPFGTIESVINNVVVIRAALRGEVGEDMAGQVLDEGSIVCLPDKRILGPIFETFGAITSPLYSIRLPSDHPLLADRTLKAGLSVCFPSNPNLASLLATQQIKLSQLKGSDASNLYDEEPGENEIEFSDDEQEQEYRRMLKQRRKMRAHDNMDSVSAVGDAAEYRFEDEDDLESIAAAPKEAGLEDDDSMSVVSANVSPARADHAELPAELGRPPTQLPSPLPNATPGLGPSSRGGRERPQRGRGARGRGGDAQRRGGAPPTGRGRGRGVPRGRGGPRDSYEPPQSYRPRPSSTHGLPPRPTFQHPDALPYDDPVPVDRSLPSRSPVSPGQQRFPSSQLPPRPPRPDEGYSPVAPAAPYQNQQNQQGRQGWPPYMGSPANAAPHAMSPPFNPGMNGQGANVYSPFQNNMMHAAPGYTPAQNAYQYQGNAYQHNGRGYYGGPSY